MTTKRVDELQVGDRVARIDGRTFDEVTTVIEVRMAAGRVFSVTAEPAPCGRFVWPAPFFGHCTAYLAD